MEHHWPVWPFNAYQASRNGQLQNTRDSQASSRSSITDKYAPPSPYFGPPPVSHTWKARPRELAMAYRRTKEHAEESAEVEVLLAHARKHDELGKKIKASLTRIQDIGSTLQAAVGPVYSDTRTLQTTNQNVDKVLAALNQMQAPLEGKADEEKIIRDGPERAGLQSYLASLRRVEGKYEQLSRNNARVNQDAARELSQLLQYGAKCIQDMFENILKSSSERIEPLQYITRNQNFPTLAQPQTAQLNELRTFLSSTQRNNGGTSAAIQSYSEIRGRYLQTSLSNLASATISTAKRSNDKEIYRQGTCGIGPYSDSILGSFTAEWVNITSIFGISEQARVLELTTSKALGDLNKTIRELSGQVKANITLDCFLAYDILGVANNLAFELEKRTGCLKQEIFGAIKPMRDLAKQSLTDLLEDVRKRVDAIPYLPTDGAAIGLTTDVVTRLQAMTAYPAPLGSILSSIGDGNWSSPGTNNSSSSLPTLKSFDVSPDSSALLAHYASDTLDKLFSGLEMKSRILYKGAPQKPIQGVFLANNVAVAERLIRKSELGQLISLQPGNKLETWRKKAHATYLEAWREPCQIMMDVQYTNRGQRPPSGSGAGSESAAIIKSMNSKEKDVIKGKFTQFNDVFNSLSVRHKELLPHMEREVRSALIRDIQALVEPMYARFWERYHEIDKGKGKYVRYDKQALSGVLASLA
jgi:exocyst complex component 7